MHGVTAGGLGLGVRVRVTRDFIVEAFTPMKGTEPIGEKQKGKQKGAQGRGAQTHTG